MTTEKIIAKITDTTLGFEGHGVLTAFLHLDFGDDHHQGAGGYDLRLKAGAFIAATLNACGVERWEDVRGRTVLAIVENGFVRGIAPLPTERGTIFIFDDAMKNEA